MQLCVVQIENWLQHVLGFYDFLGINKFTLNKFACCYILSV